MGIGIKPAFGMSVEPHIGKGKGSESAVLVVVEAVLGPLDGAVGYGKGLTGRAGVATQTPDCPTPVDPKRLLTFVI